MVDPQGGNNVNDCDKPDDDLENASNDDLEDDAGDDKGCALLA